MGFLKGVLLVVTCILLKCTSAGKIRLGFFVTSKEVESYTHFRKDYTWESLQQSLRTTTAEKIRTALSKKASFPFNMDIEVTAIQKVDSNLAGPWLEWTGKRYFTGIINFCKYAKSHGSFDIGILLFSKEEGRKYRAPYGFTLRDQACSDKNTNCIHIYGQFDRLYKKEVVWNRLVAHEIGHLMGAKEGPRDKRNPCYDIMSFTPWRIKEKDLWKACSRKSITEVARSGKLRCLGV